MKYFIFVGLLFIGIQIDTTHVDTTHIDTVNNILDSTRIDTANNKQMQMKQEMDTIKILMNDLITKLDSIKKQNGKIRIF